MEPFARVTGVAAPLPLSNVDTDLIVPATYVKTIGRTGLGVGLFHNLRYRPDGTEDPDFILNRPPYRAAAILITGTNFGAGSSREHAPWALFDFGIRCVVAPLFADIFRTNCINSGVLPIALQQESVDLLMQEALAGDAMTIDLERQTIVRTNRSPIAFDIDVLAKDRLMRGTDDLAYTLNEQAAIDAFVANRRKTMPWL